MLRALCLALLAVASPAMAQVTVYNFDGLGTDVNHQVLRWDVNGDWVDVDLNGILQVGGLFYMHGTALGCGIRVGVNSPWCGHKMYSSPDFVNWTPISSTFGPGLLFDPQSDGWQANCNGSVPIKGCFAGRIVYNANFTATSAMPCGSTTTGTIGCYVMWYNDGSAPQRYTILTSPVVTGPYVKQSPATNLDISNGGDESLFVDADGTAYLVFETYGAGPIHVQQLNATYTDGVPSTMVTTSFSGDTPMIFGPRNGVYHMMWSSPCSQCAGAAAHQANATSPTGPWTQGTDVSSLSCGGQFALTHPLTISGITTYLFHSSLRPQNFVPSREDDTWAMSLMYLYPLSFTGDSINTVPCAANFTLAGLTAGTPPVLGPPTIDQTTENAIPPAGAYCAISSTVSYFQQFVPQKTPLTNVIMPLAQATFGCGTNCTGANGDLHVDITNVDGSGNPTSNLVPTIVFHNTDVTFGMVRHVIPANTPVTPGTMYGVKLSGTNTYGAYCMATLNNKPYAPGNVLANGGSGWGAGGYSLKFATTTTPTTPPVGGGRARRGLR